jgi:hypothetical protein
MGFTFALTHSYLIVSLFLLYKLIVVYDPFDPIPQPLTRLPLLC